MLSSGDPINRIIGSLSGMLLFPYLTNIIFYSCLGSGLLFSEQLIIKLMVDIHFMLPIIRYLGLCDE